MGDLCETHGVKGFPTIKYGDPDDLQDYKGGRDFASLQKFAKENLGPSCGPARIELCSDEKKGQIGKFMDMPMDDLASAIQEKEDELKQIDADVQEMLKRLQQQYSDGQKESEQKKQEIKDAGFGAMKSVLAHRKKAGEKEEL